MRDPRVEPRAGDALGVNTQTWQVFGTSADSIYYRVDGGWFNYFLDRDEWTQTVQGATIIHAEGE